MTNEREISTRCALDLRADGLRRVTGRLAGLAADVVALAVARAVDARQVEADVAAVAVRVVTEALRSYPRDASCATCDFGHRDPAVPSGIYCTTWSEAVPTEAVDRGCERHAAAGVPF